MERLVALNHERAEEEKRGIIRWLRPEFQNPAGKTQRSALTQGEREDEPKGKKGAKSMATQGRGHGTPTEGKAAKVKKAVWP